MFQSTSKGPQGSPEPRSPVPDSGPGTGVTGSSSPPDFHLRTLKPSTTSEEEGAPDGCSSAVSKELPPQQLELGQAEEDIQEFPPTPILILLTISLCLIVFTIALDNTILATAVPKITSDFHTLEDVGWYGSAYILTMTATLPTFGKIYTMFNPKITYLVGLGIFAVGSIVCASAPSSNAFIGGRALAGIGGAALAAGALNIVGLVAPMDKRPLYMGFIAGMFGIASVAGPLLGGVFTDKLTWRWCFWINPIIESVTVVFIIFFFKAPKRKGNAAKLSLRDKIIGLDLLGASLFVPSIVCLLLALQWGGTTYAWSDSKVWGCLIGFVLILVCFIIVQIRRGDAATIPPRILRERTVISSALMAMFFFTAIYTHFFYLPFYFQVVQGVSAINSGIRNLPYLVGVTIFAGIAGLFITTTGYFTPPAWAGTAITAVAAGLLHTLKVDSSPAQWIGYQALAGVGAGFAIQIPILAVQCVLPDGDLAIGNSMVTFFQWLGAAVGISVGQNIFANILVSRLAAIPGLDPTLLLKVGAAGVREVTPPEVLPAVLLAYDEAITSAFYYSIGGAVVAFLASLGMESKSVKGKKIEMGVGG